MSDNGSRDDLSTQQKATAAVPSVARLCYVDDSKTAAYVIRRMLKPFGYHIDCFASAEPAFVALIQDDYDLLLTDLKVSSRGMDGDDLIHTVRNSGHPKISKLPVIVITGSTEKEMMKRVFEAGANQILHKPVDANELDASIRQLLSTQKKNDGGADALQHAKDGNVVPLPTPLLFSATGAALGKSDHPSQETATTREAASTVSELPTLKESPTLPAEDALLQNVPELAEPVVNTATAEEPVGIESIGIESIGIEGIAEDDSNPIVTSIAEPEAPVFESPIQSEGEHGDQPEQLHTENTHIDTAVPESPSMGFDESNPIHEHEGEQAVDTAATMQSESSHQEATHPEIESQDDDDDIVIIDPEEHRSKRAPWGPSGEQANYNVLEDLDRYELVITERSQAFGDSSFTRGFSTFIRRLNIRGVLLSLAILVVIAFAGMQAWQLFFDKGYPVETVLVEKGEIFQSVSIPGRVVSKQTVNVSSADAGRVVKIYVKEGDKVEVGQVLAKLDEREYVSQLKSAQANLASAREGILQAERTLDRLQKAHKKGAVARRFVEDAEVDLGAAKAKAGVAVEQVRTATLGLENQTIKAAFAGTVTARFVSLGQWVTPSETLFVLVDESQREIEARVDSADSGAIDVGQIVSVSTDALPGMVWQESVIRMGAATNNESNSNSLKVFISLGPDAPNLRYGQQVDADIRTAWSPNALKIPFEALMSRNGQAMVAVLEDGRVQLRQVETGIEDFSMAEIKQGLRAGETVILAKGQQLQHGDKAYSPAQGQ